VRYSCGSDFRLSRALGNQGQEAKFVFVDVEISLPDNANGIVPEKRPARPAPFIRLITDQRTRRLLAMKNKSPKKKSAHPKRILHLPDLDHAKADALNTLNSPDSHRSYRFAIDEFIAWYC